MIKQGDCADKALGEGVVVANHGFVVAKCGSRAWLGRDVVIAQQWCWAC
jgi:hypothetical protein